MCAMLESAGSFLAGGETEAWLAKRAPEDDPEDEDLEDDLEDDDDIEDELSAADDDDLDDEALDDEELDDDDLDDEDDDDLDDDLIDLDDEFDTEDEEKPHPGHPRKYED